MSFTLLTGGVRSGKSQLAVELARRSGDEVTVLATATAGDEEMAARIARHREQRARDWGVVEEPRDLEAVVAGLPAGAFCLLDCLTLWVSNQLEDRNDDEILTHAGSVAERLARRAGGGVVVTNEVGWGVIPANPLARRYVDLLGAVNRIFAGRAERAYLVVAGRAMELVSLHDG